MNRMLVCINLSVARLARFKLCVQVCATGVRDPTTSFGSCSSRGRLFVRIDESGEWLRRIGDNGGFSRHGRIRCNRHLCRDGRIRFDRRFGWNGRVGNDRSLDREGWICHNDSFSGDGRIRLDGSLGRHRRFRFNRRFGRQWRISHDGAAQ